MPVGCSRTAFLRAFSEVYLFDPQSLEAELDALASNRSLDGKRTRSPNSHLPVRTGGTLSPNGSSTIRDAWAPQIFSFVCPAFGRVGLRGLGELGAIRALLTNASLLSGMEGALLVLNGGHFNLGLGVCIGGWIKQKAKAALRPPSRLCRP